MDAQLDQNHASIILKELSDIKASLAVNTNETANIKARVGEIQADVKEIKNDYIVRREFNEQLDTINKRVDFFQKLVYSVFSVMGLGIFGAILRLVLK